MLLADLPQKYLAILPGHQFLTPPANLMSYRKVMIKDSLPSSSCFFRRTLTAVHRIQGGPRSTLLPSYQHIVLNRK